MIKYDDLGIDIKQVQNEALEILLEFKRICEKHNLKYQMFAGSLLGMVRHEGFIPWDDDIDVCMLRDDFEKFKEISKYELDNTYFLQSFETDKDFNRQFIKIRKNGTEFLEDNFINSNIHHGFFIDIFALDNVEPRKLIGKLHRYLLFWFSKLQLLRVKRFSEKIKNPVLRQIALLGYYALKLVPKNYTDRLHKSVLMFFNKKETKYISHLQNGVNKTRYYKYLMKRSDFLNMQYGKFEGYYFPMPQNYDLILNTLFGNYKELPPKEQQKPHHGIVSIKFKDNWEEEKNGRKL